MIASRNYLLGLLTLLLAFNYVDRYALGLVQESIKADLGLSDTQLGLLTGVAFAFFYALMGIPIARWADRGNRVRIIWMTSFLWSIAIALSSLAASFAQLLAARVAVAIGEAGSLPPSHSLLSDYFRREERVRAVSIFMLGGPISLIIGYFAAGWINQLHGWRTTFLLLALPSVALAVVILLTLRDPRQRNGGALGRTGIATLDIPTPGWGVTWRALCSNVTFRNLLGCFAVLHFFGAGIGQWQPSFFIRSYGLSTGALGTMFALAFGLSGLVGTFAGGWLATRYASGAEGRQLKACGIGCALFAVFSALIYLSPNAPLAFAALAVAALGGAAINGPIFGAIQNVVPSRMRATSIAIIYLIANLLGLGLGPLVAGVLSDLLHPVLGQDALRMSLLILCPGYLLAGWLSWRAASSVEKDIHHAVAAPGEDDDQDSVSFGPQEFAT